jgi:uncharacterized membrane protein
MVPLFVLLLSFAVLRCAGFLGVTALNNADLPLRGGLFLMFLVAASAHWGRGRADLIRMVPTALPRAGLLVSVTGVLEILGAIGLIFSATARLAAVCLAILLLALFPATNLSRRAVEDLQFRGPFIPDRMTSRIIGKCRIFTWAVASASRLHCGTRAALGGAGRRASSASYRALSAPIRGLPRCVPQTPA